MFLLTWHVTNRTHIHCVTFTMSPSLTWAYKLMIFWSTKSLIKEQTWSNTLEWCLMNILVLTITYLLSVKQPHFTFITSCQLGNILLLIVPNILLQQWCRRIVIIAIHYSMDYHLQPWISYRRFKIERAKSSFSVIVMTAALKLCLTNTGCQSNTGLTIKLHY